MERKKRNFCVGPQENIREDKRKVVTLMAVLYMCKCRGENNYMQIIMMTNSTIAMDVPRNVYISE